jgi:hypothetical protein
LKRQRRGWSSREQGGPRATPVDLVHIYESEEEGIEKQYVEGHVVAHKDTKEKEVPEARV